MPKWLTLFEKPAPAPKPVEKSAAQIAAEEDQAYLDELARKAVAAGALPDTSTAEERITAVETHANAGTSWIQGHDYLYNEQRAAEEGRVTPPQQLNQAVLKRQIAVKQEQHKKK